MHEPRARDRELKPTIICVSSDLQTTFSCVCWDEELLTLSSTCYWDKDLVILNSTSICVFYGVTTG
jgi:hypothetical protein